jgi:signal transduction histidine kinase
LSAGELHARAEEQAALRRVATLVARGVPPEEVFTAVTEEVVRLFSVDVAHMGRYESDRTIHWVAVSGRAGDRSSGPVGDAARETGSSSAVGAPIIVEGRLWGVMTADSRAEQPPPADTQARLASFTELVATAIANAETRAGLARLAEEQAALRRVATLVARGVPPEEVFAAVAQEVGHVLGAETALIDRYGTEGDATVVAGWGKLREAFPVGSRWGLDGDTVGALVYRTGRPARLDSYEQATGSIAAEAHKVGLQCAVASPIVVDGHLWGVIAVATPRGQRMPADAESRIAHFTELVATAIASAESHAALTASRARVVAAADETRRRIERDLHDGIQQQLVSLILELGAAETTEELRVQLARTACGLRGVIEDLREISSGIHPAILSKGGVERALHALARRSAVPVELDLHAERRLPSPVQVAAYYAVSEALTNATKHASASVVRVSLDAPDVPNASVRLTIRDDGTGGADPGRGSGLMGLNDRVEALGGTLQVTSPTGSGTTLHVEIPLDREHSAASRRGD